MTVEGQTELVSVVIATRERPQLLRQALDAVMAQDYPGPIETIVVFDQSEVDDDIDSDAPGRAVRSTSNAHRPGLAGSRNTGIELAQGRYVAFCDDDDVWEPAKLRRQVELLTRTGSHFVTCGITVEFGGEARARTWERDRVTFEDLLGDRHPEMHPSTYVFEREWAADKLGPVSEDLPFGFGEDYDFLLRAARVAPVSNVGEALVRVRWTGGSYFFQKWDAMATGLQWLLAAYPQLEQVPRGAARIHGQIAFALAAQRKRRESLRWVRSTLARRYREPRAYLALIVATGLVPPAKAMETLHKHGRGI